MTSYPVVRLRRVFPLLVLIAVVALGATASTAAAAPPAGRGAIAWHVTISPSCKRTITDVWMSPFASCEDLELRQ